MSTHPVFIAGAGAFARELYGWIHGTVDQLSGRTFHVVGFADDDETSEVGSFGIDLPVCRFEEAAARYPGAGFVLAIAGAAGKRSVAGRLLAKGLSAPAFVHPKAALGFGVSVGRGTVVMPMAFLNANTTIGEFVLVNCASGVGHDTTVGDWSTLLGSVVINGGCRIGADCTIGSGAVFHPGVKVGDGATVGIGSVVIRSVRAGTTVFGNPAKRISSKKA